MMTLGFYGAEAAPGPRAGEVDRLLALSRTSDPVVTNFIGAARLTAGFA